MVTGISRHRSRAPWSAITVTALVGVCLLCLARPAAAQVPAVDTTQITSVAQDSTGVIWATGQPRAGIPAILYRWQADHWAADPARPDIPGAWAQGVWPGPQGGVVVAWSSGRPPGTTFTWQRGNEVKILGEIEAVTTPTSSGYSTRYFESPEVTTTSSGEVLITGNSPDIYRAGPGGDIHLAYTIQPRQYLPHRQFLDQRASYLPLHATRDAQGRAWIWSGLPARVVVAGAVMRGFLLANGEGFDYHAQLPGLPNGQLTCLGRWDKNHLAAGIVDDGLYTIDTSTLTARRVTEPEPGAFRFIQQMFNVGNDRYVIASDFGLAQVAIRGSAPFGVLWRSRHRRWEKLLTGLDEANNFRYQALRPRLTTAEGLWLAGLTRGVWFIPSGRGKRRVDRRNGAPQHIDWKQGFPLDTAQHLFALQDGSFLAVDLSPARTVAVTPNSLLTSAAPAGDLQVIDPFTTLQPDQRRHIWGMLTVDGQALDEWNGEKWTAHPLPGNINPAWLSGLDVDSEGLVWLFPDCRMGPMAVFDPHNGRWTDYPSYQAALAARLSRPVRFLHPGADRMKPTYGPDSQIVYNGACQGINYFDGNNWHLWNRPAVPGDPGHFFDGPAFFDAAVHVAVNINHKTREWLQDQGWRLIPFEPNSAPIVNFFTPAPPANPPEGCASTKSSSLSRDPLGRSWWTWEGSLYEGVPGLCRKALAGSEPQPFIDGRLLRRVMADNHGNVFLETLSANRRIGQYVVLNPSGELPHTTIQLTKLSADSVSARFESSIPGGALFTWRLDGGDWSAPEKQGSMVLRSLAGGEHRLEAASIDSRLRMDAVPASADFSIGVKPNEQIPALIARLENARTDDERIAAIEALARQPASAVLPALKAARAHASGDERWWIDAAIQEVTQRAHQSTPGGNE
jgi:hypothetical protein